MIFTGAAILLSEATSNTASANMIVPVAIAVAQAAGVRAVEPALGATLGASMGFMMPISTAPNAIVYSSGFIPITAMMRYGIVLDVVAFVAIVTFVMLLGPVLIPLTPNIAGHQSPKACVPGVARSICRTCDEDQRPRRVGRGAGTAGSACCAATNVSRTPCRRRRASR